MGWSGSITPTAKVGQTVSSPTVPVGSTINSSTGNVLQSNGNILPSPYQTNQTTSSTGGTSPTPTAPTGQTNTTPTDPYAQIRSGISSQWDNYLGSLNDIGNTYLPQQQAAQTGIADSQLQQGQGAINQQKASSLRDIANTTRNAFQAGNNYLGSMGAGDSSASNQYAFAINQQANKQTGDLNNYVNGQLNNLQATHDQQINQIANWFSQQQEALKQQIAQGQLQKGQDLNSLSTNILNQAIAATQAVKQNTQNQYNSLVQWAANNSQGLGQLQQNIAAIPQAMGQIQLGQQQMTPTYGGYAPTGAQQVHTDIFGNRIQ